MSLSSESVRTPLDDVLQEAERQLTICNACRYCEGYCAVFPALARRTELTGGDLDHLANICHDCRACLYACMYAPPHEFAMNPPKALAAVRRETYDGDRRRAPEAGRQRPKATAAIGFLATLAVIIAVGLAWAGGHGWWRAHHGGASPYSVIPYAAILIIMALPFLWSLTDLVRRGVAYWRRTRGPLGDLLDASAWRRALIDAGRLRYLKGGGAGCQYPTDRPSPLRRRLHGAVAYGFGACVVSTVSAAVEQDLLGTRPPYPWFSVPVIAGTIGGIGIALGCVGLIALKTMTFDDDVDVPMRSRDYSLLSALLILAVTGIAVLLTRSTAAYAPILLVHLAAVFVAFASAAQTKFAHILYRLLALVQDNLERADVARAARRPGELASG